MILTLQEVMILLLMMPGRGDPTVLGAKQKLSFRSLMTSHPSGGILV